MLNVLLYKVTTSVRNKQSKLISRRNEGNKLKHTVMHMRTVPKIS